MAEQLVETMYGVSYPEMLQTGEALKKEGSESVSTSVMAAVKSFDFGGKEVSFVANRLTYAIGNSLQYFTIDLDGTEGRANIAMTIPDQDLVAELLKLNGTKITVKVEAYDQGTKAELATSGGSFEGIANIVRGGPSALSISVTGAASAFAGLKVANKSIVNNK